MLDYQDTLPTGLEPPIQTSPILAEWTLYCSSTHKPSLPRDDELTLCRQTTNCWLGFYRNGVWYVGHPSNPDAKPYTNGLYYSHWWVLVSALENGMPPHG